MIDYKLAPFIVEFGWVTANDEHCSNVGIKVTSPGIVTIKSNEIII